VFVTSANDDKRSYEPKIMAGVGESSWAVWPSPERELLSVQPEGITAEPPPETTKLGCQSTSTWSGRAICSRELLEPGVFNDVMYVKRRGRFTRHWRLAKLT